MIDANEYLRRAGTDTRKGTIGKAYQMYQERLKAADAMDFDDMICKTVELLQKNPDVLEYYHNVTEDVLYRGDDVWNYATYSATKISGNETIMEPYYTMIKTQTGESKIGLIIPYTLYGK